VKPGKAFAILTLVMTGLAVLGCVVPHVLFVRAYGRLPLRRSQDPFSIPKGASTAEVRETLGPPHDRQKTDGGEIWHYHADLFGFVIYGMEFDADGRLVNTWW
jgi:hypothetical protein